MEGRIMSNKNPIEVINPRDNQEPESLSWDHLIIHPGIYVPKGTPTVRIITTSHGDSFRLSLEDDPSPFTRAFTSNWRGQTFYETNEVLKIQLVERKQ